MVELPKIVATGEADESFAMCENKIPKGRYPEPILEQDICWMAKLLWEVFGLVVVALLLRNANANAVQPVE